MPLVTNKEILVAAQKGKYAVGAFNINNMEIAQAIVQAAEEERSPVILAVTEGAMEYAGIEYLSAIVKVAAEKASVSMALHLDHGKKFESVLECIRHGFTSVMIDASDLNFEQNIAVTKRVVEVAHPVGMSVEAELGRLKGIEDLVSVEARDAFLTDPKAAEEFVERTGVDALAVAIGTSHGAYKFKGEAVLDFDRLKKIRELVKIPLVLHGASSVPQEVLLKATKYGAKLPGAAGVPDEDIKKVIQLGISKINIDTDIRLVFTSGVREVLYTQPDVFDPRKIVGPARDAMKEVVRQKMRLFGSSGRA